MKDWLAAIALKVGARKLAVSLVGETRVLELEHQSWFG